MVPLYTDGIGAMAREQTLDEAFFGKVTTLRDEILGGTHPLFNLSPSTLELLATYAPPMQNPSALQNTSIRLANAPPTTPHAFTPRINPILLEKSVDLINAEAKLRNARRLRAEQALNQRTNNDADSEDERDTQVVLANAHQLVMPVSGFAAQANDHLAGNNSPDVNSYYSSQAYSWSSADVDQGDDGLYSPPPAFDTINAERTAAQTRQNEPVAALDEDPALQQRPVNYWDLDMDDADIEDEDDYSPPPVELPTLNEPPGQSDAEQAPAPAPEENGRIVTSHIRTPAAPQPSRVSPLALGKLPAFDQTQINPNPTAYGPTTPGSGPTPSKGNSNRARKRANRALKELAVRERDREQEPKNKKRQQRDARPPSAGPSSAFHDQEPFIKPEPESPPPFSAHALPEQPQRRIVRQPRGGAEFAAPVNYGPRPMYRDDLDRRYVRYVSDTDPQGRGRLQSPIATRRTEREGDLRRVASLQHAMRPQSPGFVRVPYGPQEVRYARVPTYPYDGRMVDPQDPYRSMSVLPVAPQYIRERSRSPVHMPDNYRDRHQSPAPMAAPPPSDAVLIDEHGRRHYTAAEREARASVAPQRRVVTEPYMERASTREPAMRAPARVMDCYDEAGFQAMPPPPSRRLHREEYDGDAEGYYVGQRQLSQYPEAHRYRQEYDAVPIAAPRRAVPLYEDDMPSRAYSVRPETVRREGAGERITRIGSAVPGSQIRHAGGLPRGYELAQDDGYAPRRYGSVVHSAPTRYVDEYGVEVPMAAMREAYTEDGRRVVYR
ncbi:hypothetical protein K402DRAFT_2918 [Aulographum hederae CBS 113979]|uniref:Uncharacterized protein n=1 Tax=Aulographum hederae CBS 113979 TaxID=1176131 RepID=A0A6G1HGH9_9PEZI|nr:hypothetical protein K402DRAFT_2918 [Aulographum hederae CBS 113979]